jgi:hypothetical protein
MEGLPIFVSSFVCGLPVTSATVSLERSFGFFAITELL